MSRYLAQASEIEREADRRMAELLHEVRRGASSVSEAKKRTQQLRFTTEDLIGTHLSGVLRRFMEV